MCILWTENEENPQIEDFGEGKFAKCGFWGLEDCRMRNQQNEELW